MGHLGTRSSLDLDTMNGRLLVSSQVAAGRPARSIIVFPLLARVTFSCRASVALQRNTVCSGNDFVTRAGDAAMAESDVFAMQQAVSPIRHG